MPKCEHCGKEFNEEEEFYEYEVYYSRRMKDICGDCESELYDAEEEGYFEGSCEECGKTIDIWKEYHELESRAYSEFSNWSDLCLSDFVGLCVDCGIDKIREYVEQLEDDFNKYGMK